jgi:hypothetical protein
VAAADEVVVQEAADEVAWRRWRLFAPRYGTRRRIFVW